MVGILVHGDNHFVVRGALPSRSTALALVQQWSLIQIGAVVPDELRAWTISAKEFREDLKWAVLVPGDGESTPAVVQLLGELEARGVKIRRADREQW